MKKLQFVMMDYCGYMEILSRYLDSKRYLLESRRFTNMDKLLEYLQNHKADVLLLGQEVELDSIPCEKEMGKIIILSEENIAGEQGGYPSIFKYQSAEKILQEILELLAEDSQKIDFSIRAHGQKIEFAGIYSPSGMAQNPVEEIRLCKEDSLPPNKVLLLNMELFDGLGKNGDEERIRGMSELIFYIRQRKEKISLKLQSLVQHNADMDYLCPVTDYRDLYSLHPEDIDCLLAVLSEDSIYEKVYFAIGFLSEAAVHLLWCCDKLYLPSPRSQWEKNKQDNWLRWMACEGMESVAESVQYLQ